MNAPEIGGEGGCSNGVVVEVVVMVVAMVW